MSEPFIAQIAMFAGTFAPRGWAFCNGQLLPIAQNTALFSLLGTTYGGNGQTSFGLPNLQGRVPMHAGQGPGLSQRSLGELSGQETANVFTTNMASHTHSVSAALHAEDKPGDVGNPTGNMLAQAGSIAIYTGSDPAQNKVMAADSIVVTEAAVGGNQGFSIMDPYLVVNFIIALQGVYPSRN